MKKRHAYLIMAHSDFESLKYLLRAIDDDSNDIYLHIDKKAKNVLVQEFNTCVKKSHLYIVPRIKIFWGHMSIVDCELRLLESAISNEHYHYYHLLSGNDFPLKSQDEIHRVLDNDDFEHIDCFSDSEADKSFIYKVKYFFPLFRWTGKGINSRFSWLNNFVSRLGNKEWESMKLQERLGIDRTKKYGKNFFYKGDQWFSITDDFARFLVANQKRIFKIFKMTNGPDEMFISTMAMNSEFGNRIYKDKNGKPDNLRLIDWNRGNPYEFKNKDFEELKVSDKLFVRKVSYNNEPELIENLFEYITSNKGESFE